MSNINIAESGFIWGKWQVDQNNWILTNGWGNFCYLLIGNQKAMLIDTGYGEGNIRMVVEEITDKPVIIVNTHGHCDHLGGNIWWNECFCGLDAQMDVPLGATKEFLEYYHRMLPDNFVFHYVKEGDVFDLGGRHIEVIEVAAHAKSSIMLLDKEKRQLYTGDEIDPSQVLLVCRHDCDSRTLITNHLKGMDNLILRQSEFDILLPSHNGVFISKQYINDFAILDRQMLKGENQDSQSVAGFNWAEKVEPDSELAEYYPSRRASYGLASIIYYE